MTRLTTLKAEQQAFYKSIVSVYCPILKETVYFTSQGFNHLLYESNRKPRNVNEQYLKLINLKHAPTVVKYCTQLTDVRTVGINKNGREKIAIQYGLVCEVEPNLKVRVIVEKIGETGKHKFVSVMPHNRKSKSKRRHKK